MTPIRCAFALLSTVLLCSTPPAFALPKPKLKVQETSSGDIKVTVSFSTGTNLPKGSVIKLRRSLNSDTYQAFKTFSPAKLKQSIVDSDPIDGIYRYRARVERKKTSSKWSGTASLIIANGDLDSDDGVDSTPTPAPTTPPELVLPSGQTYCPINFTSDVLAFVNIERAAVNLGPLQTQAQLAYSAELHSSAMASANNLSHDNWFDEILASGFQGSTFGQNVALGWPAPASVVSAWMASPGHKANILKSNYLFLGVGCVVDANGSTWWTQNFGG